MSLLDSLILGVDVSSVQGVIDWHECAKSRIRFAWIKCAEGNHVQADPQYDHNMAGCRDAGIPHAPYLFMYPIPTIAGREDRAPEAQAKRHLELIGDHKYELPLAIDLEWPTFPNAYQATPESVVSWTEAYLQHMPSNVILYSYPYYLSQLPAERLTHVPLWLASYAPQPVSPKPWSDWTVWQYSGGGERLPNGAPVDGDAMRPDTYDRLVSVDVTDGGQDMPVHFTTY